MLVSRSEFDSVLGLLNRHTTLAVDTETTGLRPYHGDRLFSIIVAVKEGREIWSYYFNFLPYEGMVAEYVLLPAHLERMKSLFSDPTKTWRLHNAKYDQHILAQENIFIQGTVHCTKVAALLEYNEHNKYDLNSCAERIGEEKDDAVEKYITEHKLTSHPVRWINVDGKANRRQKKDKHFDRVPAPVIIPYAEQDAIVTYRLGEHQEASIERLANEQPSHLPSLRAVLKNERRLLHTVFRMEHRGVRIDRAYCVRAAFFEADRAEKARQDFKKETGRDFKNSSVLFKTVFASDKDRWAWNEPTKTGQVNPCFESEVIKRFENPAAQAVLQYRDAKSKNDFYNGFLYHADSNDIVHPNFNQDGAGHGRFSSSEPNFQNLTSEEDEEDLKQEFVVRRAIIPRDGFVFFMPDYDQMEYRMLFDVACESIGRESPIVKKMNHEGLDPHQATADVVTSLGTPLNRKRAKNGNFAGIYGSGADTLAETIGGTREDALALRSAMRLGAPEVFGRDGLLNSIISVAKMRGYIFNWFGRRCYFPDPNFAYRGPNYFISGGCADVMKIAMNEIDEDLLPMKSKMVMTVHDELPTEVHESELATVPRKIVQRMESVYPWKYLPLTVGAEWSDKSLADKKKGYPV